jgi:hypothetical protein
METKKDSENGEVNVVYASKLYGIGILHIAVLISEGPELKAHEVESLQESLSEHRGEYEELHLGKYDLSKIGKSPGIYKNEDAKAILRKIGC